MPSQVLTNVENNFTKGLVTEFTGLNFPENAATDCDNVTFTLVGDVNRRLGIGYEPNHQTLSIDRKNLAVSSYKWNNAGGNGSDEIVVVQVGTTLRFYLSSTATVASPLSAKYLASTVNISSFLASGGTFDPTVACEYSDGNGYLFVTHPNCNPFYCIYSAGAVTAAAITVQIRDFSGIVEPGVADITRPGSLSDSHLYNLLNQGWRNDGSWQADSATVVPWASLVSPNNVNNTFVVAAGLPIVVATAVRLQATIFDGAGGSKFISGGSGVINSYAGVNLIVNTNPLGYTGTAASVATEQWAITPINPGGQIGTWTASVGGYPSNADVWWQYKTSANLFDPLNTLTSVTLSSPAPKGSFIFDAFIQNRNALAGTGTLTTVSTTVRPRTSAWFQGRVWYAGVDASQAASGTATAYSWTESIYFSQVVKGTAELGKCYQVNDPSSEDLFDLLPTDGGEIKIQGCGPIYKLFAMQNALLVFAANGIWYITGSQGIGFTANDYTIVKLSAVRSISSTSFVSVNGYPYFWNEEGIYKVEPTKQDNALDSRRNALEVTAITVGTILSFYNEIPQSSKKYVRGAYDPIEYVIQWIYKDTEATTVTDRYSFNKILNFNTHNSAFFPYTIIPYADNNINSIVYVSAPGGATSPDAKIKYVASDTSVLATISFADEHDTSYLDWLSSNYTSYFVTGFKLHGQGQRRFQIPYIYVYSRADEPTSYKIQGLWDYATSGNSGRWSTAQLTNNWSPNFGMIFRRHKIRGQGLVLQIKVSSTDGEPFDIMGWSAFETQNAGV